MFRVETNYPVASWSLDHKQPHGAKLDNSRWHPFNKKMYELWDDRPLFILDIGCAGGGFVADCIADSHNALGIDGCDVPKKKQLHEWKSIPDNLFTADATEDYAIYWNDKWCDFHCITAWEVMEHIPEDRLKAMLGLVRMRLKSNGYFITSISNHNEMHHVTQQSWEWWEEKFNECGLYNQPDIVKYFDNDWVRGAASTSKAMYSKHFVWSKSCQQ